MNTEDALLMAFFITAFFAAIAAAGWLLELFDRRGSLDPINWKAPTTMTDYKAKLDEKRSAMAYRPRKGFLLERNK